MEMAIQQVTVHLDFEIKCSFILEMKLNYVPNNLFSLKFSRTKELTTGYQSKP